MPPKKNPLKLNKLQLRTLALAQLLARDPSLARRDEATGVVTLLRIPHPDASGVDPVAGRGAFFFVARRGTYFPAVICDFFLRNVSSRSFAEGAFRAPAIFSSTRTVGAGGNPSRCQKIKLTFPGNSSRTILSCQEYRYPKAIKL